MPASKGVMVSTVARRMDLRHTAACLNTSLNLAGTQ
jgi:hypothetical protein